jgi:hypothetical protein
MMKAAILIKPFSTDGSSIVRSSLVPVALARGVGRLTGNNIEISVAKADISMYSYWHDQQG